MQFLTVYWIESKNKLQNLTNYCLLYILKEDLFKARNLEISGYKHLSSFYKYVFKSLNKTAVQKHTFRTTYICETQLPSSQGHMEADQPDYYEDQGQTYRNITDCVKPSILVLFLLLYPGLRYTTKSSPAI